MSEIFDKLNEIGETLAQKRLYAVQIAFRTEDFKERLNKREIELIPAGGWGSNAEIRKTAAASAVQADPKARRLLRAVQRLECVSRIVNAEILGLEDRRRGLEYTAQAVLKGIYESNSRKVIENER